MRKLIFMLIPLVWVICPGHAAAKSYSVSDIHVQVEARPDGDIIVEEQIPYHFAGSFFHRAITACRASRLAYK